MDPFLTKAKVAEFISRDPARVTGYVKSGVMPEPDLVLEGGTPLWRRSTIRSWWLGRGGAIGEGGARYHQPITGGDVVPELLEDRIVEVPVQRSHGLGEEMLQVHVRVYAGMDGKGPVVLLGTPGKDLWGHWRGPWLTSRMALHELLVTDVDMQTTTWILVCARWRWSLGRSDGGVPDDVDIIDLDDPRATLTPADVCRLIGRPFDIFPQETYTAAAVQVRSIAGLQDTVTPTAIVTDTAGLEPLVRDLHVAQRYIEEVAGSRPEWQDVIRYATGVLADEVKRVADGVEDDEDYRRNRPIPSRLSSLDTGPMLVAVTEQARSLTAWERGLVERCALPEPLYLSRVLNLDAENREIPAEIDPQAPSRLTALRAVLQTTAVPDRARDALTRAEQVLTTAVHNADPVFARSDRSPARIEWGADFGPMSAYLNQLARVPVDLPERLQWRVRQLQGYEYMESWEQCEVLYDDQNDILALVGMRPSRMDEVSARDAIRTQQREAAIHHQGGGPEPVPLSADAEAALIASYLAPRRRVYMEWPLAPQILPLADLRGQHLVAPSAGAGYRPVFRRTRDGRLHPLPITRGFDDSGFVWGVSSTDTFTPAVHDLLMGPNQFDRTDPWEWTSARWAAISRELKLNAGGLDADLTPLVDLYQQNPITTSTSPHAPAGEES